jgi:polyisoprenoid-binding protein YceI
MRLRPRNALPLAGLLALAAAGARSDPAPQAYAVDPAASHVRIHLGQTGLLKFLGHEHHIEAPVAEGRVEVVEGDPGRSSVEVRFEAARLAILPGSEPAKDALEVEGRMRGPEVLDVGRHPEICFRSTSVRQRAQHGPRYTLVVEGTLTLRDRSVPVEIPLEVVHEEGRIEARPGHRAAFGGRGGEGRQPLPAAARAPSRRGHAALKAGTLSLRVHLSSGRHRCPSAAHR